MKFVERDFAINRGVDKDLEAERTEVREHSRFLSLRRVRVKDPLQKH